MLERLANDSDVRHRMGEYNRRYAREFAASRIATRLEETYAQVMGSSGSSPGGSSLIRQH
jgi:hypothetical protein